MWWLNFIDLNSKNLRPRSLLRSIGLLHSPPTITSNSWPISVSASSRVCQIATHGNCGAAVKQRIRVQTFPSLFVISLHYPLSLPSPPILPFFSLFEAPPHFLPQPQRQTTRSVIFSSHTRNANVQKDGRSWVDSIQRWKINTQWPLLYTRRIKKNKELTLNAPIWPGMWLSNSTCSCANGIVKRSCIAAENTRRYKTAVVGLWHHDDDQQKVLVDCVWTRNKTCTIVRTLSTTSCAK